MNDFMKTILHGIKSAFYLKTESDARYFKKEDAEQLIEDNVEELLGDFDPDISFVGINFEGAEIGEANPINADTLGGYSIEDIIEQAGGGSNFPVMVDNIEIEEEGVISITLDIDLTACKEARFYISVPKNESGGTKNFYVASANVVSSNNMSWLSSFTNIATGTTVFYKAISETLGEFAHATGMQGSNISATTSSGGTAAVTAVKSPRTVSNVTQLIWADASSSFPIGTKVQTFMWG